MLLRKKKKAAESIFGAGRQGEGNVRLHTHAVRNVRAYHQLHKKKKKKKKNNRGKLGEKSGGKVRVER